MVSIRRALVSSFVLLFVISFLITSNIIAENNNNSGVIELSTLNSEQSNSVSFFESVNEGVTDAFIEDMIIFDNKLVCIGDIYQIAGQSFQDIAAWNGTGWESLNNEFSGIMQTATIFNNRLVVGAFYMWNNDINGQTRVMQYDGVEWTPVGDIPITTIIRDIVVYNDMLIIAGYHFDYAGENDIHGIIAVNSDNQVVPIGSGTLGAEYKTNTNNVVHSLAVYDGKLYAGGIFSYMDMKPVSSIAVYDGTSWEPVPGSQNLVGVVHELAVYNGELIVSGYFPNSPSNFIMKYDGSTWSELPGGAINGFVETMTVTDDLLIVGGDFTKAGGALANHIATWNGTCWGQIGDGVGAKVMSSEIFQSEYFFGGYFDVYGDSTTIGLLSYSGVITPCACCNGIRGNLNADFNQQIDIGDLLQLVDFMFVQNSSVDCYEEANIDGSTDNQVDITDLLYLVDYMFTPNSPEPASCQ